MHKGGNTSPLNRSLSLREREKRTREKQAFERVVFSPTQFFPSKVVGFFSPRDQSIHMSTSNIEMFGVIR